MAGAYRAWRKHFPCSKPVIFGWGGKTASEHGCRVTFPKESAIPNMPMYEPERRLVAMPAYLGGRFHVSGIKTYGSDGTNTLRGLPRSILMMQLLEATTGVPLAYMAGNELSAVRTVSVAGLGVKYLHFGNIETAAFIGVGVMSLHFLDALMFLRPDISKIKIKGRGQAGIENFILYAKGHYPQIKECVVCKTSEEACRDSDIVFVAASRNSRIGDDPYVKRSWLKCGSTLIAVAALRVDDDFFDPQQTYIVMDNYERYAQEGNAFGYPAQLNGRCTIGLAIYDAIYEKKIHRKSIHNLANCIDGTEKKEDPFNVTLLALGGMPIEDVAWGYECFIKAKSQNIGKRPSL